MGCHAIKQWPDSWVAEVLLKGKVSESAPRHRAATCKESLGHVWRK